MKISWLHRNKSHTKTMAAIFVATSFLATGLWGQEQLAETHQQARFETPELSVRSDDYLLTISARNVTARQVLDEIGHQLELDIVLFRALDEVLFLDISRHPLPVVLPQVLLGGNFQLYQSHEGISTLWVFSEGESSDATEVRMLQAELIHGDNRARRDAVIALRKLGSQDAVGALSFALTDEDGDIRSRAIYALAAIGGDDAVVALASAGVDENAWVRGEAAAALASIGSEGSVHHLKLALHDPDRNVRASVIAALADIPGERSAQILALALQDPDPLNRIEAVEALQEVGGESAVWILNNAAADQDAEVKIAIDEVLTALEGHQ